MPPRAQVACSIICLLLVCPSFAFAEPSVGGEGVNRQAGALRGIALQNSSAPEPPQLSRALTSAQLPWWRLVCNAATLDTWRVCNLQYFTDRTCSGSSPTPVAEDWEACFPCTSGGDARVTIKFASAVEVQCVEYTECASTGGGFGLGGQADCPTVTIERSDDGSSWNPLHDWANPIAGVQLVRLDTTTTTPGGGGGGGGGGGTDPQTANLVVTSSVPDTVSSCVACSGSGMQPRGTITMDFNDDIQLGSGTVTLQRGSLSDLTLTPQAASGWFSASGNTLRILPQQDLAGSGECLTVRLGSGSLRNLDGQALAGEAVHRFCVVDFLPPELTTSGGWEPANGQIVAEPRPEIKVTFDEAVELSQGGELPELSRITLTGRQVACCLDVRVRTWNSFTGAGQIILQLSEDLEPDSTYDLTIPAGYVRDVQGNEWVGGGLQFDTNSFASTSASSAGGNTATGDDGSDGSVGMIVGIAVVVLVFCCCGVAFIAWQIYLNGQKQAPKSTVPQAWAAPPAKGSAGSYTPTTKKDPGSPASNAPPPPQGPRQAAQADGSPGSPGGPPRRGSQDGAPTGGASKLPKVNGKTFAERMAEQAPPPPKHRSYEAEDVRRDTGPGGARPAHTSFTQDDATGGDWIKAVDKATGRPYWYHYKTMETRWEKPTGARERAPGAPKADTGNANGVEANLSNLQEAEEVARVKAELLEQLRKNFKEDLALRKKTFKFMCFQWHPDKNQDRVELATPVFQFLQEQRGWFLEEA